jgi:hypothetical protein
LKWINRQNFWGVEVATVLGHKTVALMMRRPMIPAFVSASTMVWTSGNSGN